MASKPPPSTLVLFVRHGKTPTTGSVLPGRAKGLHLSDEGRAQAAGAAERLAALPAIDAVYCSPLERCRETAAPLEKATGLRATVDKRFIECDFGEWTGRALKDLRKLPQWHTVQHAPSQFAFPGGESFLDMQARITGATATLQDEHPGQTVVVYSHADPIKAVLAAALGTPLDLFQRITVSPCSVSSVLYGATGPSVLTINAVNDLGSLRPS